MLKKLIFAIINFDYVLIDITLKSTDIVALIVSYNGLFEIEKTVNALLNKVGHIHIIDNASEAETLIVLRSLNQLSNVTVTYFDKNYGIGKALNHGIAVALKLRYKWILTMDQDSVISENMIDQYCQAINTNPEFYSLSPKISVFGNDLLFNRSSNRESAEVIDYAITSGHLVNIDIFEEVGLYDEDLFIDCVDFDFSLRLRLHGYSTYRINNAVLYHNLGEEFEVPKIVAWFYTSHSPLRRYYMYRNFCYMVKKYIFKFPTFVLKTIVIHLLLFLTIPFYDKNPGLSLISIKDGIFDFVRNKKGQYIKI